MLRRALSRSNNSCVWIQGGVTLHECIGVLKARERISKSFFTTKSASHVTVIKRSLSRYQPKNDIVSSNENTNSPQQITHSTTSSDRHLPSNPESRSQSPSSLRQPQQRIASEVRSHILTLLSQSNQRWLTKRQLSEVANASGLTRKQIYNLMRHLREEKGTVTADRKQKLWEWLKDYNFKSPTTEERDYLISKLGWNRRQLNQQIHMMRDIATSNSFEKESPLEDTTENNPRNRELKDKIDEEERVFTSEHDLSFNSKRTTKIHDWQLRLIESCRNRIIALQKVPLKNTPFHESQSRLKRQSKLQLRAEQSERRRIVSHLIHNLMQETGLPRKRLYNVMRASFEVRGKISNDVRHFIRNWFEQRGQPTTQESWELLEVETNLSRTQLYAQFRYIRESQPIPAAHTPEENVMDLSETHSTLPRLRTRQFALHDWQRNHIRRWLHEHDGRWPSPDERQLLLQETQLSIPQLKSLIQRLRKQYHSKQIPPPLKNN